MSSVLCNMKRVSITFLPHTPVKNRAQVLQTPPYTCIHYATPSNFCFSVSLANTIMVRQHTPNKYCVDITFYLTNLHQYILRGNSHRVYTLPNTMWTTTTSTRNNKKRFHTLNTPLNKSVGNNPFTYCSSVVQSNKQIFYQTFIFIHQKITL